MTRATPAWWFGAASPPWWTRLLEPVYRSVIAMRRAAYRRGWLRAQRIDVPVIVVGGLIAGGSGKTPFVIALVQALRERGWTPGVASRGYGRADAAQPMWVDATTDAHAGGDEPVLIAHRTGARVRVDADRVAAARALRDAGCDIVVCDDGLQHYRLARDIEIEVVDGRRRYGNARMLPAGPLREPIARGAACDLRVLNLGDAQAGDPAFGEWPMRLLAQHAVSIDGATTRPLDAFSGQRVHAVAGIGDPERFFAMLRALGIELIAHPFADHHRYLAGELQFGDDLPVLMTEKDAVKCRGIDHPSLWSVPIDAQLPQALWLTLDERLKSLWGRGT